MVAGKMITANSICIFRGSIRAPTNVCTAPATIFRKARTPSGTGASARSDPQAGPPPARHLAPAPICAGAACQCPRRPRCGPVPARRDDDRWAASARSGPDPAGAVECRHCRGFYQRAPKGETVLVVEDEKALREVTRRIFSRNGYHVITAANGPEALGMAADHPGEIHLLVTDVVMPRMLGKEVAEKMRLIKPEIEVIFMSGYARPVLASQGRRPPPDVACRQDSHTPGLRPDLLAARRSRPR
jgi:CheY-like chemotaxis protein